MTPLEIEIMRIVASLAIGIAVFMVAFTLTETPNYPSSKEEDKND